MIKITISRNSKHRIYKVFCLGHANFAEQGNDIVCAAASILIINTFNAIERFTIDRFDSVTDEEQGMAEFTFQDSYGKETDMLLKTMIMGLQEMEDNENYTDYIDLLFEEV